MIDFRLANRLQEVNLLDFIMSIVTADNVAAELVTLQKPQSEGRTPRPATAEEAALSSDDLLDMVKRKSSFATAMRTTGTAIMSIGITSAVIIEAVSQVRHPLGSLFVCLGVGAIGVIPVAAAGSAEDDMVRAAELLALQAGKRPETTNQNEPV